MLTKQPYFLHFVLILIIYYIPKNIKKIDEVQLKNLFLIILIAIILSLFFWYARFPSRGKLDFRMWKFFFKGGYNYNLFFYFEALWFRMFLPIYSIIFLIR